jgi:hypothetical protein
MSSTAVYAQDKYSLKSPDGSALSDLKRYEDWAVVSSARTDEVLKVIVANPTMIEAYKAGVPNNGQPFPGRFKDCEAPVEAEEVHGDSFCRGRARRLHAGFRNRKGQQEISKKRRMGIRALFNYEAASDQFAADPSPSDCGYACHTVVKAKDDNFYPYQKR